MYFFGKPAGERRGIFLEKNGMVLRAGRQKIGSRYSGTELSHNATVWLLLGNNLGRSLSRSDFGSRSLSGSLALLAGAFALGALLASALAFAFLALLAAGLLFCSGSVLLAVTAATYHCNGCDKNNK